MHTQSDLDSSSTSFTKGNNAVARPSELIFTKDFLLTILPKQKSKRSKRSRNLGDYLQMDA